MCAMGEGRLFWGRWKNQAKDIGDENGNALRSAGKVIDSDELKGF